MRSTFLILIFIYAQLGFAQNIVQIDWLGSIAEQNSELKVEEKLYFKGAFFVEPFPDLPRYVGYELTNQKSELNPSVIISSYKTQPLSSKEQSLLSSSIEFPKTFELKAKIVNVGLKKYLTISGYPVFKNSSGWQKVVEFEYEVDYSTSSIRSLAKSVSKKDALTSVLSSGQIFKVGIQSDGMYEITYADLESMGFNVDMLDPRNIQIFGNEFGELPETITNETFNLKESSIEVIGESDGSFDVNDKIIFFGKGPDDYVYDEGNNFINYHKNRYADVSYYFIKIGSTQGKRINQISSPISNQTVNDYWEVGHHESETTNLIQSGKEWYGEYFDITTSRNFVFNMSPPVIGTPTKIFLNAAVRSFTSSGNILTISANGSNIGNSGAISSVSNNYTAVFARNVEFSTSFNTNAQNVVIGVDYNKPLTSSVAWLDYITLNRATPLNFDGTNKLIRNPSTIGIGNVTEFQITSNSSVTVWDVTNPVTPVSISVTNSGGQRLFSQQTEEMKTFALHNGSGYLSPILQGEVTNQNILALTDRDYYIICPDQFNPEANRLAQFHQTQNNYTTAVVNLNQIYNEFSSGNQDVSAIRNFMKYLKDYASSEANEPKYLMLLGDASYDYKNITSGNSNVVPTFQSDQSLSPLSTFCSDDYFAMLDSGLSIYNLFDKVNLGVGRFPGNSVSEVRDFVNKVINYQNPMSFETINNQQIPKNFGNWRNEVSYVADDGNDADNYTNAHFNQTEFLVDNLLEIDSNFNVRKIYMDNYVKEPGAGGGKYPTITRDINTSMNQGTFVMSYIGHGGENGWADERVLEISDIDNWNNQHKLPIFLTATCEFSRYDNPGRVSAGEKVILNPNGGAIAMLTTVRLVFGGISNNIGFSRNFFDELLTKDNGENPTLGDAVYAAKVISPMGSNFNNRKFALLGDPGMKLGFPRHNVKTNSITTPEGIPLDTISALSKVKISGEITDFEDNLMSDFNGVIYPTVFDKKQNNFTRDNNNKNRVDSFYTQRSVLFQGKASVNNGKFEFEFIVPKDIDYRFGKGRISYYAASSNSDANGYYHDFIIGGSNTNAEEDKEPPVIKLFLNDTSFVNGGLSDETPLFIAHLSDNSGINTSGNGIGRDMVLTLNGDNASSVEVNDFYQTNIDSYTSGRLEYLMEELPEGEHQLSLKAWDIHNNSSIEYLDFVVSNSEDLKLENVLNYPNPFTTRTTFMFEHNQPGETLTAQISILTITGKVVKTLTAQLGGSGSLTENTLDWDGLDDFGGQLGRGVYIYRLKVITSSGLEAEKIEKLVLLK